MKSLTLLFVLGICITTVAQDNVPGFYRLSSPDFMPNNQLKIKKGIWPVIGWLDDKKCRQLNFEKNQFPEPLFQLMDSIYILQWDTVHSVWSYSQKTYSMVYDANNNLISYLEDLYSQNAWEKYNQWIITFDENNDETKEIIKRWNGIEYEDILQRIYTFNNNHKSTNLTFQKWANNVWENFFQYTASYDQNNNQLSYTSAKWNGSEWSNQNQDLYTYNEHNDLILQQGQYWYNEAWNTNEQWIISYDANYKRTYALEQNWDIDAWYDTFQEFTTYDTINNSTTDILQDWDGFMWTNNYMTISNYDDNNNLIQYFTKQWNGNNYSDYYEEIYTYDNEQFLSDKSSKYFNTEDKSIIGADSTHYYFRTISGSNTLKGEFVDLDISPNPSSGNFVISNSGDQVLISCYTIFGDRIYQTDKCTGENPLEIDLSAFGKGLYLIIVENDKKRSIRKILIQ